MFDRERALRACSSFFNPSPAPALTASAIGTESRHKARHRRRKLLGLLALGIVIVLAVGVYVGARSFSSSVQEQTVLIPGELKPWKVEVVNITGQSGVAQRATDHLRSLGYDVVDYHSRPIPGVEKCAILDRRGDPGPALEIAESLGLTKTHVQTKVDRSLLVDVTVVIAYDARLYPALKKLTEKGM